MTSTIPDNDNSFRYTAELANRIESKWQKVWDETGVYHADNPVGDLAGENSKKSKMFIQDMFPYPSGAGLHVGHPLGFISTDVFARFHRMLGKNVMHSMGFDAFGLPTEQFAIQQNIHPAIVTKTNIDSFLSQLKMLGLGHDERRRFATTDPQYYKWTQWIFGIIYNSWFDETEQKAKPISELIDLFANGSKPTPTGQSWNELDETQKSDLLNEYRLAYVGEASVNWCPGLGTVLAAEEVTADNRSERGNFPVFKRSLKQWMMRITAYSQRLIDDLALLEWPEQVAAMQKNWIGKSKGTIVSFKVAGQTDQIIKVFTTRADTIYGVSYLVVSPEYNEIESLIGTQWAQGIPESWTLNEPTPADAVKKYQHEAAAKSEIERTDSTTKTGVFTGSYAINPITNEAIPIFVADYVLAGYGTGAVMGVPAHDERDEAFATTYQLPIVEVIGEDGKLINSSKFTGLTTNDAMEVIIEELTKLGVGEVKTNFRLRDWVFSRQRFWGEPFPIVYDEQGRAHSLPDSMLPVELPDNTDFKPITFDPNDAQSSPQSPLDKITDWVNVTLDLGDGPKKYRRETNTMPNWAGSCWYYLRYGDPHNLETLIDPVNEKYWFAGDNKTGGVDLYVGGTEHAVLHLLYSRFWHKVLFDRGCVSFPEPFRRLFNQGMIQGYAYTDSRGFYVPAEEVEENPNQPGQYLYKGEIVNQEFGKIGKSLKNAVSPNEICSEWGADTFRVYEMSLGPLDQSSVWSTKDIVGSHRFLQRLWRVLVNEQTGELNVDADLEPDTELAKQTAKTIQGVSEDYQNLRMNTAVAKLIQLVNYLTKNYAGKPIPTKTASVLLQLVSPVAPHIAEELWHKLGNSDSIITSTLPQVDETLLGAEEQATIVIQINGKLKTTIQLPSNLTKDELTTAAQNHSGVAEFLTSTPVKIIAIPGKLVNFVL